MRKEGTRVEWVKRESKDQKFNNYNFVHWTIYFMKTKKLNYTSRESESTKKRICKNIYFILFLFVKENLSRR